MQIKFETQRFRSYHFAYFFLLLLFRFIHSVIIVKHTSLYSNCMRILDSAMYLYIFAFEVNFGRMNFFFFSSSSQQIQNEEKKKCLNQEQTQKF